MLHLPPAVRPLTASRALAGGGKGIAWMLLPARARDDRRWPGWALWRHMVSDTSRTLLAFPARRHGALDTAHGNPDARARRPLANHNARIGRDATSGPMAPGICARSMLDNETCALAQCTSALAHLSAQGAVPLPKTCLSPLTKMSWRVSIVSSCEVSASPPVSYGAGHGVWINEWRYTSCWRS
jgi:hypothetical protein